MLTDMSSCEILNKINLSKYSASNFYELYLKFQTLPVLVQMEIFSKLTAQVNGDRITTVNRDLGINELR